MATARLPEGFRWTWAGDTVRVDVPPIVKTATHAYEPVLSRGDAELLAKAVWLHERRRVREGGAKVLARILLAHDPRYSQETLAKFRTKLSIAMVERGQKVDIDEMVTMSGTDLETEGEGGALLGP